MTKSEISNNTNPIFTILIISIVVVVGILYFTKYEISTVSSASSVTKQEPFSIPDTGYGNIIAYSTTANSLSRPLDNRPASNIIRLPAKFRITGFKFNGGMQTKYRLYVGDGINNIISSSKRIEINLGSDLALNTEYTDKSYFENQDGSGKYVGDCLAIDNYDDTTVWPAITSYVIYGVYPYSPDFNTYNLLTEQTLGANTSTDKLIGRIKLTLLGSNSAEKANLLKYLVRYTAETNTSTELSVNGPLGDRFIKLAGDTTLNIYLDKPILANNIKIYKYDDATSKDTEVTTGVTFTYYGSIPTERDKINYKLQSGVVDVKAGSIVNGSKCPAPGEMLNKQVQAQLICESLEYKDKEKNQRLAYERDKLYLQKLKAQEEDIKRLEKLIGGLVDKQNTRVSNSQGSNVEDLEKELRKAESARKEAETYMYARDAARQGLNFKLNLDPQFSDMLDVLEKTG